MDSLSTKKARNGFFEYKESKEWILWVQRKQGMATVEGVDRLKAQLLAQMQRYGKGAECIVGYTMNYAIFVHENLKAYHHVGQAKFLEDPLRRLAPRLVVELANRMRQGMTLEQALLTIGLQLQRESQLLCPVDTGALKGSAFTRIQRL